MEMKMDINISIMKEEEKGLGEIMIFITKDLDSRINILNFAGRFILEYLSLYLRNHFILDHHPPVVMNPMFLKY